MKLFAIVCYAFIFFQNVYGQTITDTIYIAEIDVVTTKIETKTGFKEISIDSLTLLQSIGVDLGELLSSHSPVFIKSYGQGGMATSSYRGAGAGHTQVSWNGIRINQPMLGQVDFSQIPVFFIDDIKLYPGGGSLSEFSGALGGSIQFKNNPNWEKSSTFRFAHELGSFNYQSTSVSFSRANSWVAYKIRAFLKSSENNYTYQDQTAAIKERENAAYEQYGILQEIYYRPYANHVFSLNIWLQKYTRQLPENISVVGINRREKQKNDDVKTVINWQWLLANLETKLSSAFLYNDLKYTLKFLNNDGSVNSESLGNIKSTNYTHSFINQLNLKYSSNNSFNISLGISHEFHSINTINYSDIRNKNDISAHINFKKSFGEKLITSFLLRQDVNNSVPAVILPSLSIEYQILNESDLFIKANISKNHHTPNLNDLYWYPGGNPQLKNEGGFLAETGFFYSKKINKSIHFEAECSFFYSKISDRILWQPSEYYFWRPVNIDMVETNGIEADVSLNFNIGLSKHLINQMFTYTSASVKKTLSGENTNVINKQLIYVPKNQYNICYQIRLKNFYLTYTFNNISNRYTQTDNLAWLNAYSISDILVGYQYSIAKINGNLEMRVNNLFDEKYESVKDFPMPGRSFQLSVNFDLTK